MGNYANKPQFQQAEKIQEKCQDLPQTPTNPNRRLEIDPRSATVGITRTPIEILCTPVGSTDKAALKCSRKPYLETDIDQVIQPLALETCFDPRSPNTDQPRTPIWVAPNEEVKPKLDKFRQRCLTLDPRSPATDFDRTPILKQKSPVKAASLEDIAAPSSELLYCEMTTSFSTPEIQVLPDVVEKCNDSLGCDYFMLDRPDATVIDRRSALIETKEIPRDKITIWQDHLSPKREIVKEEVIIEFDRTELKVENPLQKRAPRRRRRKAEKVDEKVFENEQTKSRTPLANRSNGPLQSTTKSPQQLLRPKTLSAKSQQENTPPQSRHLGRARLGVDWDLENTVVI